MGLFNKPPPTRPPGPPDEDNTHPGKDGLEVPRRASASPRHEPIREVQVQTILGSPAPGPGGSRPSQLPQSIHPPSMPHEAAVSVSPAASPATPARFGIEEAVTLLKQMPHRENEAVRRAVHLTLSAMQIDRGKLVESAAAKDVQLQGRIERLRAEVERHNALALAAQKEIAQLEAERSELAAAKGWLVDEHGEARESPVPLDRVRPH